MPASAIVAATSAGTSSDTWRVRDASGSSRHASTATRMPSGTWLAKMPGHPNTEARTAPTSGPMTAAPAPAAKYRPSATTRASPLKFADTTASAMVSNALPPRPCIARPRSSAG